MPGQPTIRAMSGIFVAIPSDPTIGGDRVAFVGLGSGGQKGVYVMPQDPTKIADTQTRIPGGVGNFTGFGRGALGRFGEHGLLRGGGLHASRFIAHPCAIYLAGERLPARKE